MMMASNDKANYVVNYFTFEIADIVNSSEENLPICEYEVITEADSSHIEIVNSEELIENSAINKESAVVNVCNDNGDNHESRININQCVIIANASEREHDYEIQSDDLIDDDENDEIEEESNNNSNNNHDDDDLEDLTNLNWLTELKNITNLPPTTNDITEKTCDPPSQRFDKFITQVNKMRENYEKKRLLFETVASEKPPFNYAQIIGMALLDEGRMTLKQICDWIESKFAYYKIHKNWNNSIRHNLSLNFFFTKVARDKNEKGKGGYWELAVDMHKTARKRIRHRRKKMGEMQTSANSFIRGRHLLRSAKVTMKKESSPFNEMSAKSVGSSNVSDFISSPSNINEDSNPSMEMEEQNVTEIEIVDEQQHINNIVHDNQNTIIIPNSTLYGSPNVIVEAIPTYQFNQFNNIEHFDDNELNQLICMNDQDLIDDFLSYNNSNGEFL